MGVSALILLTQDHTYRTSWARVHQYLYTVSNVDHFNKTKSVTETVLFVKVGKIITVQLTKSGLDNSTFDYNMNTKTPQWVYTNPK